VGIARVLSHLLAERRFEFSVERAVFLTVLHRLFCPGNVTDVKTLVPVVNRLQSRFAVGNVCIVADRGMISAQTKQEIQKRQWKYILGVRMRRCKEVKDIVLSRSGRYQEVFAKSDRYKQLWMVEAIFRSMKSLLEARPIFHKCDATIRGHVFCSFLFLLLCKELQDRLANKGLTLECTDVIRELNNLVEMDLSVSGKPFTLRGQATTTVAQVFSACGVALPPTIRQN